jgi:hypothetical protein
MPSNRRLRNLATYYQVLKRHKPHYWAWVNCLADLSQVIQRVSAHGGIPSLSALPGLVAGFTAPALRLPAPLD